MLPLMAAINIVIMIIKNKILKIMIGSAYRQRAGVFRSKNYNGLTSPVDQAQTGRPPKKVQLL